MAVVAGNVAVFGRVEGRGAGESQGRAGGEGGQMQMVVAARNGRGDKPLRAA